MWSSEPARGQGAEATACFAISFAFLLTTHWSFLGLPYHWDELGYFVPAAHDLLSAGALVPRSTLPNVHPPLVMAYLAAVWELFGFAVPVTRAAMLVIGASTVAAAFLLARQLAGSRAAWTAAALIAVSPPFVAQSMLAHLDLAAAMWALLSLHWFLQGRWRLASAAATALVLTKETGLIVPLALAVFSRRKPRCLLLLLPPVAALGSWLLYLHATTGHWLGSGEFARYNVGEALDPWRPPLVLLRRLYQLGFANFHWIATGLVAVAVIRHGALRDGRWRLPAAVGTAYVAVHSLLGGAILLRYLLPAMALFYVATAAALEAVRPALRRGGLALLLIGLAGSNWWDPPYPFGYEDNLAVTDFIRLQQQAAAWLAEFAVERRITTAWPLTDALSNPLGGYVDRPLRVVAIENFQPAAWDAVDPAAVEVVALYSRSWDPPGGWQRWPPLARLLERRFGYRPQLSREEVMRRFGLSSAARWERRGQWMEILVRPGARVATYHPGRLQPHQRPTRLGANMQTALRYDF